MSNFEITYKQKTTINFRYPLTKTTSAHESPFPKCNYKTLCTPFLSTIGCFYQHSSLHFKRLLPIMLIASHPPITTILTIKDRLLFLYAKLIAVPRNLGLDSLGIQRNWKCIKIASQKLAENSRLFTYW